MNPTTPRPDPVTEARDELVREARLLTGDAASDWGERDEAWWHARIDNLIALVRAEAWVSVEALAYGLEGMGWHPDRCRIVARVQHNRLAARSAGSGSRVCVTCGRADGSVLHGPDEPDHPFRPTPPPAVDGTRVKHTPECGGRLVCCSCHLFTSTPPAPDPDRLRALEAALRGLVELVELEVSDDPYHVYCDEDSGGVHRFDSDAYQRDLISATAAARALLADGERSE